MRKLITLFAALAVSFGMQAQQFQQVFTTPSIDTFTSVATTNDNGFIFGGYTNGIGNGTNQLFLVRTTATGDTLWNARFGGQGNDGLEKIERMPDGNFAFVGSSSSTNDSGNSDVIAGVFSEDGELLWSQFLEGDNVDIPYDLAIDDNGNLFITGITNSFNEDGSYDVFVSKLSSTGALQWFKVYGSIEYEASRAIGVDDDGNIYVWGHLDHSTSQAYDWFILKLDTYGTLIFTKSLSLPGSEIASAMAILPGGDLLLTGDTDSVGQGYNDIFLTRMTSEGEFTWSKTIGAYASDHSTSIEHIENDMYMIAGATASFGAGGLDFLSLYVNDQGDVKNIGAFGGEVKDVALDVVKTSNDGIAMVGTTRSFGSGFGSALAVRLDQNFECACNNSYDGGFMSAPSTAQNAEAGIELRSEGTTTGIPAFSFVLGDATECLHLCGEEVVEFTSESDQNIDPASTLREGGLKIQPNPSKGPVTVTTKSFGGGHVKLEVFNLEGRILQEYLMGMPGQKSESSMVLRPLPTGIYLVRMTSGGQVETKRMVIQ